MAEFDTSTLGTHYGHVNRICQLWGETWDASRGQETAKGSLARLNALLRRIQGLKDSHLYQRIPRRGHVAPTLQITNLLSNDPHYRGVSRLWGHWSRLAISPLPSPHELHIRHQGLHYGFNAWCMLAIIRACAQLRLNPIANGARNSEIRPGCFIQCNDGFSIDWERGGAIVLKNQERILLRYVPIVHALEKARWDREVKVRITPLIEAVDNASHWTVFLHPALSGTPSCDVIAGIDNPPDLRQSGAVDFIRVSPFSLESVERIARAIRWVTLVSRMLDYPPKLSSDIRKRIDSKALRIDNVVQPLERKKLSILDTLLKKAEEIRDNVKQQRNPQAQSKKKKRGSSQLQEAEKCVQELKEFKSELYSAQDYLVSLATCPTCNSIADFFPRDRNCFKANCRSCKSSWELRPNSDCRIPVFLPNGVTPNSDTWTAEKDSPKAWVDNVFGCDVLAIPESWGNDAVKSFLAPRTERLGRALKKILSESG